VKGVVRDLIIKKDTRPDGRGLEDIRQLEAVAGLLPKVHGSGLFTRGQTQVLTVATLGLPNDAQTMDGIEEEEPKRYMHFYNFPPYSVERFGRCAVRAEEKWAMAHSRACLATVIPLDRSQFPLHAAADLRSVESNGSTSWRRSADRLWR